MISNYKVATDHMLFLSRSGDPMLGTQTKAQAAWADGFIVKLFKLPRWMEDGTEVSIEARHPDGRHVFTSTIMTIERTDDHAEVVLSQPLTARSIEFRRARRVDLDRHLLWSRLDADGHPGVEHDGTLVNLSATGLRFRTRSELREDELLMFSLGLDGQRVNVWGRVVGSNGAAGEVRVDFGMIDVPTRRELVAVVADHRQEPASEVLLTVGMLSERLTKARLAYDV